ncbi:MAG TPA: SH3 domain-containing protein [Allosphingosinicella sp.]|nr:SH3 domain-containing protein [Allosphingosinicella sp.]
MPEVPVEPALPEEPELPELAEQAEPEEPPSPFGPSRIPDFMGDAPPPPPRVTASGRLLPPEPVRGPIERDAGIERSVTQLFGTIFARRHSKSASEAEASAKRRTDEPKEPRTGVPEVAGWVSFAFALAIAVGLFMLFGADPPRAPGRAEPGPRASAAAAAPSLYVSAALLNCRAAPSLQAERVRRIERGEQVALIAEEGEWISIAHEGRQCWAQAKYLAAVQPL